LARYCTYISWFIHSLVKLYISPLALKKVTDGISQHRLLSYTTRCLYLSTCIKYVFLDPGQGEYD